MSTLDDKKRDLEFKMETMLREFIEKNSEIDTLSVTVDSLYDDDDKLEGTNVDIEYTIKESAKR